MLHWIMKDGSHRPAKAVRWYAPVRLTGFLLLGLLLLGCARSNLATSPGASGTSPTSDAPASKQTNIQTTTEAGQQLPLSAQIEVANQVIQLEVAGTQEQQAIGLMSRTNLPDDRGMLFLFESPRRASFWMKNTLIPLDMIFLLNGKVQAISSNVPPCEADPCPTYGPNALVDQVIELRAGRAAELGLKQGDRINVQKL
ncbi:FIG00872311: hypothetical protein [uncultured Leptolyngbya sp.]|uniref:DUF192 domain-containing protein n=1 Tax=uncultured Leptolyngbya sp. TaxID=332963 RepID=A0A6J4LHV8_9CYAN|nr:FIG00872311: hypothetical protein [uncultured Leptolyngbya sp.]